MEPLGKQGAHQNQDLEFKGYYCVRIQEQAAVCPAESAVTNCPCFGRDATVWVEREICKTCTAVVCAVRFW